MEHIRLSNADLGAKIWLGYGGVLRLIQRQRKLPRRSAQPPAALSAEPHGRWREAAVALGPVIRAVDRHGRCATEMPIGRLCFTWLCHAVYRLSYPCTPTWTPGAGWAGLCWAPLHTLAATWTRKPEYGVRSWDAFCVEFLLTHDAYDKGKAHACFPWITATTLPADALSYQRQRFHEAIAELPALDVLQHRGPRGFRNPGDPLLWNPLFVLAREECWDRHYLDTMWPDVRPAFETAVASYQRFSQFVLETVPAANDASRHDLSEVASHVLLDLTRHHRPALALTVERWQRRLFHHPDDDVARDVAW